MKLTILGNNGPFPGPGGACSGYLLEDGSTRILLDCGNGVLANLQKVIPLEELDAVILTHLHNDHVSDMAVFKYAVQIKRNRGTWSRSVPVYAPDGPQADFDRLKDGNIFEVHEITSAMNLQLGGLELTFREMKHPVKTFAVSVSYGHRRFVFSGDTAWTEDIVDFCRGADVVMLDCGLLQADKTSDNVPHLTAGECGKVAREAGAKRLLLTHFWPEYSYDDLLREAREEYPQAEVSLLMQGYDI